MTRDEWIDSMCDFTELVNFCNEEGYEDFVENYYDDYGLDEILDEYFYDRLRDTRWYDVRDEMADVPQGYDWYFFNWGDVYGVDDYTFRDVRDEVLRALEENDFFDSEDEEDEEEQLPEYLEPCEPDEDAEAIDVGFFVSNNADIVMKAEHDAEERRRIEEERKKKEADNNETDNDPEEEAIEEADLTGLLFSA